MPENKKITVLFVNPSTGLSGDTQSLGNLIDSMRDKITPIVLLREKDAPAYAFFQEKGVECIVHRYLLLLEPMFWDKLKNTLFHFWRLRLVKWLRFELPCRNYLKKVLKDRHVDIIHSNRSQVMIGCWLSKTLGVPHVWHIREYPVFGERRIHGGISRLKKSINEADARIVVSGTCRKGWGIKDENTWTIYNAVRSEKDCCYEREKKPYLLFLSNVLYEAKGAGRAVEAFAKSGLWRTPSEGGKSVRLKMVGHCDEAYKKELLSLADRYGCAGTIEFVPAQRDVKPLFAHALAFLNPSINEGLGRTTAEAMFFGCPVIAHASGGTLDLIRNGETGYLFNTVDECAARIRTVFQSDQEGVIIRAQQFAREHLSVEPYGQRIMEVYQKVL